MIMQDLLEKIKIRPEIYLGEKSFTRLIAFIRGYEYCQNKYHVECSILEGLMIMCIVIIDYRKIM